MLMKDLEKQFNRAKNEGSEYIAVQIYTKGNVKPELIINQKECFDKKLEYYRKAYTDKLVLKTYEGISIKGIAYGNNLSDIENALIKYHN